MGIEVVLPSRFALKLWPTSTPSCRSMSRCIYNSPDARMHCHPDVCCTTSCKILRTCQPCRWVWGWTKFMQLSVVLVLSTPPASPLMQVIDVVLGTQHPGPWKCPSCCSVVAVPSMIVIVIAHSGFRLSTNWSRRCLETNCGPTDAEATLVLPSARPGMITCRSINHLVFTYFQLKWRSEDDSNLHLATELGASLTPRQLLNRASDPKSGALLHLTRCSIWGLQGGS
jgi:hypothetical protein